MQPAGGRAAVNLESPASGRTAGRTPEERAYRLVTVAAILLVLTSLWLF